MFAGRAKANARCPPERKGRRYNGEGKTKCKCNGKSNGKCNGKSNGKCNDKGIGNSNCARLRGKAAAT
jgi:hypothetical protein